MNEYLENQLNKSVVYQQLKDNCERNNQHEVLALVAKVGTFAVERLKTVIKNMPEFTLHDDTHIFNMLTIIGKLIPQENMRKLSTPDLFMLIVSVFLHDIGMAPDEKHILAWKNQLPETEYDEELKEEREKFARFRLTYTHQLADIERLEAEQEFSKAQLLEDYIVTEYIRTTHSIRAREIIAKYWAGEIVYQDTDLTENLATICFSHNESYTYLLQMETFRVCGQDEYLCIPFVATVLRLADIIDFDPKRTPSVLFSHLAVKNPVSLSEWKKHQSINAWTISPRKLLFSAQCEHPAIEATILAFCNQIDEELRNGTVILSNLSDEGMDIDVEVYKISLPPQVDRRKIQAKFDNATTVGLLLTLVLIFASQTEVILSNPLHIVLIAVPLTIQTVFIFFVAYIASKILGMSHDIAAPAGMIGASNFFELAAAVAITLFGTTSPAALATTVGVLTEVPVMLALVKAANNTKGWFKS